MRTHLRSPSTKASKLLQSPASRALKNVASKPRPLARATKQVGCAAVFQHPARSWPTASHAGRLGALSMIALAVACGGDSHIGELLTVTPDTANVVAGGTQSFAASQGASNTAVAWSVDEGSSGGSISAGGVYTAPLTRGTYHVRAVSAADRNRFGTATVNVTGALSLVAGEVGGAGSVDGAGSAARFNGPFGMAADSAGNLYVADLFNNVIRRVTPAGVVSTFAGVAGSVGNTDGQGSAARLSFPTGVAVDATGTVYVADYGAHTIRKITSAGMVTTLAGLAGYDGSSDGTGSGARFKDPRGVAVDGAGNVYVADSGNYTIRKVAPNGAVTTVAGLAGNPGSVDGTGSAARFRGPWALAVFGGTLYVADLANETIRSVTAGGVVTTLAGTAGSSGADDGIGSSARFTSPSSLAVDGAGNVYVADTGNNTVRKISPARAVSTFAGLARSAGSADGVGFAARFSYPSGVAVDSTGNVYVGDSGNNTLRKVTPAASVTTLAGLAAPPGSVDGSGSAARFSIPTGVVVDGAGNVYVGDTANHTIRKISPAGAVSTFAGRAQVSGSANGSGSDARFYSPEGLAADAAGNIYVADTSNHTIRKITPDGTVSTFAGQANNGGHLDGIGPAAQFLYPEGVAVDSAGNVYVADSGNDTIRKISPTGAVITLAGHATVQGSADGIASAALFSNPTGVAVDAAGNVYVADSYNNTIRKITPGAVVSTLAGVARNYGSADGVGAAARFAQPTAIAVDGAGIVYVADNRNHTIRKITPDGVVKTVVGQPEVGGIVPGPLPGLLAFPRGVALTPTGDLVITTNNAVVRAVGP